MISSLILALRFLTVVPVPGREVDPREALGRAAWWFPIVGLALGIVLAGADRALRAVVSPMLAAALVLAIWKAATGAIHLDGLADCLDGLAGHDRVRRLAIMQDSRIGVFGAVGLTFYLLIAFVGLGETPTAARGRILLVAPVVGRLAPLLIAPRFRPAKPDLGTGAAFLRGLSPWAGLAHLAAVAVLSAWLLGPLGPAMMLASLLVVLLWTAFLAGRFGGMTGEVLGSVIELSELAILLEGVSLARSGAICHGDDGLPRPPRERRWSRDATLHRASRRAALAARGAADGGCCAPHGRRRTRCRVRERSRANSAERRDPRGAARSRHRRRAGVARVRHGALGGADRAADPWVGRRRLHGVDGGRGWLPVSRGREPEPADGSSLARVRADRRRSPRSLHRRRRTWRHESHDPLSRPGAREPAAPGARSGLRMPLRAVALERSLGALRDQRRSRRGRV